MPKTAARQTGPIGDWTVSQRSASTPGRCRASRPLYRRIVTLLERGIAPRRGGRRRAAAARARSRARRSTSAARRSSAPIASSRRAGWCAAMSAAARSCRRGPTRAARRSRGAARSSAAALQANDTTVRDLVRAAGDPRADLVRRRRSRRSTAFPTDGVSAGDEPRAVATQADAAWRHGPTEGHAAVPRGARARFGGQPRHILVLAGAQQGLDLLARCLIDPGDAVIIDRPGYLGAMHRRSATPARAWSAGISAAPTPTSSRSCCCGTARS